MKPIIFEKGDIKGIINFPNINDNEIEKTIINELKKFEYQIKEFKDNIINPEFIKYRYYVIVDSENMGDDFFGSNNEILSFKFYSFFKKILNKKYRIYEENKITIKRKTIIKEVPLKKVYVVFYRDTKNCKCEPFDCERLQKIFYDKTKAEEYVKEFINNNLKEFNKFNFYFKEIDVI